MEQQQQQYGRGAPGSDSQAGLEESMWQLGLGTGGGGAGASAGLGYPERPGEPDCVFYMRTGSCGYGDRCRFNHPRSRVPAAGAPRTGVEFPERIGQPVCQYFMKTGTCKFGATCKYHHPNQGGSSRPVQYNYHGYPMRPGEKECSYYTKTGHCKFGATCKFHHPQPAGASAHAPAPTFYPAVQSSSVPPPQTHSVGNWPVARPPFLPGSYVQGAYGPIVLSPGVIPVSGWSPYPPHISPVVSPGGQQTVQAGSMYGGPQYQLSASAPAYPSHYLHSSAGPSSGSQKERNFPERPGQPECQFYMRTGDCKYGPTCRYHHPPEWSVPKTNCVLNPLGLPLRPGAPPCTFYTQHGVCKFGPTCKFDHPMGTISYGPSASSLADMPVAPYPVGFAYANLAPSSSSSDLRPEFFAAAPSRDSFSVRMPLSGNTSSGSIGSTFSASRPASQSFVPAYLQSSTTSSSNSVGHGGEIMSSS